MNIAIFNKVAPLVRAGKALLVARRPELLLGSSIAATLSAVVLAARGGYKSGRHVQEYEDQVGRITTREKFDLTWKNYIPAAAATTVAIGSTTALHLVHVKDKKALAQTAMMAASEGKKIVEDFDPADKSEDTTEALVEESDEEGVIHTRDSDGVITEKYLVRDAWSGRDFFDTEHGVESAIVWANRRLLDDGDISLNDVYATLGMEWLDEGANYGWSGPADLEIAWSLDKRKDGRPVRVFTFRPAPEKDYTNRR